MTNESKGKPEQKFDAARLSEQLLELVGVFNETTKLILLDSLLQEVEATLPHLVLQKRKGK